MRKAIVIGNSHTIALQAAPQREGIEVYRIAREKNGKIIGDISFENAVALVKASAGAVVVSAFGGNQHQMFLLQHPEPFDFMEPGDYKVDATAALIPYHAIRDLFSYSISRGDGQTIAALRQAADGALYHLEVPPPKADEAHLRKRVEQHFRAGVQAGQPFTRADIRAKLWRLQRTVTKAYCDETGVSYVPVPNETKLEGDFLDPAYYAPDATHANAAFGSLVLDQVAALARL